MNRHWGVGLAVLFVLGACSSSGIDATDTTRQRSGVPALPAMKTFSPAHPALPRHANTDIAADFLELSFQMESGRKLDTMTRFTGPVTIKVAQPADRALPPTLQADLTALLGRLRREAKIAITQVGPADDANIVVEVISRRDLQRVVPQAACFVVPNVQTWREFKRARRSRIVDWTQLNQRTRAAIFLPGDVSPQEIRDCLHEELAQALGPLNDVYRLPDSVFNDDNFHAVLTGFDMLILRAYYSPELRNGMTRKEAQTALRRVLRDINPAGQNRRSNRPSGNTPRVWIDEIEIAVGPGTELSARRSAAARAVTLAKAYEWRGPRAAFALYVRGRLALGTDSQLAVTSFLEAFAIYNAQPETAVHSGHVAMQLAAFSLTAGRPERTLALVNAAAPAVADARNAALLSTLLMLKAEALDLLGRPSEARAVRLDSLGWARYGFGSERVVRTRLNEIASLAPRPVREARANGN
ncbi:MAG: hypothetical protein ACJAQW_001558 [Paracoccaceae bacterium]|jgi:hypothetical protein